jgi:hypothetical protein
MGESGTLSVWCVCLPTGITRNNPDSIALYMYRHDAVKHAAHESSAVPRSCNVGFMLLLPISRNSQHQAQRTRNAAYPHTRHNHIHAQTKPLESFQRLPYCTQTYGRYFTTFCKNHNHPHTQSRYRLRGSPFAGLIPKQYQISLIIVRMDTSRIAIAGDESPE